MGAMPNREQELHDLERADQHIEAARKRVARQRELVAELERDGHDATRAQALLKTMEAVLVTFEAHRETILEALDALDPAGRRARGRT
jgi:hypothetical protein